MTSELATLTSKGQVTIPKAIRDELGIGQADRLLFSIESGRLVATPLRRRSLADLRGAVVVDRPFPGHDEIRREIQGRLGERVAQGEE